LAALAAAAGVAIDNARLYDEARRRQAWLEATNELTRSLLSGSKVDAALGAFARRVGAMTSADLTVVALPDSEREDLVVVAADGIGEQQIRWVALDIDDSLLGSVFKSGQLERIEDAAADPRSKSGIAPDTPLGPAILVPLGDAGHVRGVLAVARAAGAVAFDDKVLQLVSDLAVQAAVVLELADRRRDSELLSLYADRDRIGRDLHDLAIQRLFATSMS
ncbi:GAF domain-containing protein, partial [Actinospica sp. MGRD01-02]